ncbi:MAG: Flp pilus assembly complex ATPase component TadA, partial [Candidatus Omnitrophica bacterium]|nr:Flp pilus assembly complex ATPase component TadA [Candidatus Omnitrophota bacterium]
MLKTKKNFKTGAELIHQHLLKWDQVREALEIQEKSGEFIGQILIRLGYISERQLLEVLADQFELPVADPTKLSVPKVVLEQVPPQIALHYHIFPVEANAKELVIAMPEPPDLDMVQELSAILGVVIKVVLAERAKIDEAIKKHYGVGASVMEQLKRPQGEHKSMASQAPAQPAVEDTSATGGEASVRELVNQLLIDAQKKRASDIHIEPFSERLRVRYRIDGILHEANVPKEIKAFQDSIISRIKIMARLDISERRLPQDGRIKVKVKKEELDLRISTIPTAFGESLAIRLLSPEKLLSLEHIGLSEKNLAALRQVISKSSGIVLLTGPTGCGKTTTLYACLHDLNSEGRKIITVEEPVEYQLSGIIQMQVHPKIGLTFANGLRHMLRHDPDVLMVGEIRDTETAEIAIRSALTGHLVLSTLHTNDAPTAVTRLIDLGIEPYLVSSSLDCVIAQRLVRLLCSECKKKTADGFKAAGCDHCAQSGFYGRTAIHELLLLDAEMKELVSKR